MADSTDAENVTHIRNSMKNQLSDEVYNNVTKKFEKIDNHNNHITTIASRNYKAYIDGTLREENLFDLFKKFKKLSKLLCKDSDLADKYISLIRKYIEF